MIFNLKSTPEPSLDMCLRSAVIMPWHAEGEMFKRIDSNSDCTMRPVCRMRNPCVQAQIPSYNSAPNPGVRDLTQTGGMRWMGSARGAQNVGSIADSGLVTSVSGITNTMVSRTTCALLP